MQKINFMIEKKELIGLSKEEIAAEIERLGEKPFRAKQLWQWLYFHGETDFEKMSSFSKDLRAKLSENFTISRPKIVTEQLSSDKTRKWLFEFKDGQRIETVYIPEEDRGAVCISTQVGCAVGCKFCHTGSQKITRNLTAGEIVSQFMAARDAYHEWPSPKDETRYLSNIVVMGMGEPLHNMENVIKALKILTDGDGIAISKRRVTLSTSGIAPNIVPMIQATGVKLAISLHAPNNEKRSQIMPINKHIVQGINLNADGTASSIGMETLKYEQWKVDGKTITLKGKSIGNGQTIDFTDTLDIIEISPNSLKLGKFGQYRVDYYRVEEIPDTKDMNNLPNLLQKFVTRQKV